MDGECIMGDVEEGGTVEKKIKGGQVETRRWRGMESHLEEYHI